ncbi:hypothetical protein WICPIJ_007542 [Wickerhamomyces pijperi]|uniref:CCZ1/INTU/HSP4 first Longin domain-containing protein n=1 Tax=Wickerhamomyces pijperi TaxID=599730 RepID=A0A9P8PZN5_WICPI|nr:hypothetical protein WICPIJ_007542 [Wickerhamomyces pijperi]
MDYINRKLDGQLIPLHIEYFAIYDPLLSREIATEDLSVITFITPSNDELQRDNLQKQRELSMVQGLYKFTKELSADGDDLGFVELDDKVVIVNLVEDRYYFMLSVKFNKLAEDDLDNSCEVGYNKLNMAPFQFLQSQILEVYAVFKLHHGEMTGLFENLSITEFKDLITNYFALCFTAQSNLNICENGFLKVFQSLRTSSLTIDYNLTGFLKNQETQLGFKELIIWNDNSEYLNEYGLVYKLNNNLTSESLKDLICFIEKNDHYNSLNKDDILQSYVSTTTKPKSSKSRSGSVPGTATDEIFNPFKVVIKSINNLNELTGVSDGLHYGVDTIHNGLNFGVDSLHNGLTYGVDKLSTGFSTLNTGISSGLNAINGYIPFTPKFGQETDTNPSSAPPVPQPQVPILEPVVSNVSMDTEPTPIIPITSSEDQDVEYLIGLQSNGSISYKNVYLEFSDLEEAESKLKLYKLVIFKILNFKFLMIYEFDQNCINEMQYYGTLSELLFKIHQSYLSNQQTQLHQQPIRKSKFYHIESYPEENRLLSNMPWIPVTGLSEQFAEDLTDNYDDLRNKYINILIHKALYKYWNEEQSVNVTTKESFIKYKNWNIWVYHHQTTQAVLIMLNKTSTGGSGSGGKTSSSNTNIKITDEAMLRRLESFRYH